MSLENTSKVLKEREEEKKSLSDMLLERQRSIEEAVATPIYFDSESVNLKPKEYKKEYKQRLLEHLARGFSVESFLGSIGVTAKEFESWKGANPEIAKVIELGQCLSLGKFEKLSELVALGIVKGNATMLWNIMKNRHPEQFKDKVDVTHSGDMTFNFNTGVNKEVEISEEGYDFKESHYQISKDVEGSHDS